MAGIKNKYDFYKGFLEALGAEGINETDYKNEEELRKKILDALGVEYVFDDVNQTDLFREKFLQGISSSGGGGSSDFSTAVVTFANSNISDSPYQVKGIIRYREDAGMTDVYPISVSNEGEQIINIPLYKGKATLNVEFIDVDMSETPIITGGIAIDPATRYMIITGDGTFTAKSTD